MKTRTILFIVVALLVGLGIGYLVFKKTPQYPVVVQPDTSTSTTTTPTSSKPKTGGIGDTSKVISSVIPAPVHLGSGQHVTTTKLVVGQKLIIAVQAGTDGGYNIDPVQYNAAVLNLVSHTFTPPAKTAAPGASGVDTFEFVAVKSGTTGITITQSFNHTDTNTLFSGAVSVQ